MVKFLMLQYFYDLLEIRVIEDAYLNLGYMYLKQEN